MPDYRGVPRRRLVAELQSLHAIVKRMSGRGADAAKLQEQALEDAAMRAHNEELREAHEALEAARDKYADLFEEAPVGYLAMTTAGIIEDLNLTGACLFGQPRERL